MGQKISDIIAEHIREPGKAALRMDTGEVVTYQELMQLFEETRAALARFAVKPHERVALIYNSSLNYIPMMLAIMEDAVCVPLDVDMNAEQMQEYYELLSVDYIMTDQDCGPAWEAADHSLAGLITFETVLHEGNAGFQFTLARSPQLSPPQPYKNADTALVLTTSGTSSKPKIVPKLYRDMVETFIYDAAYLGFEEESAPLITVKFVRYPTIQQVFEVLMTHGTVTYTDGIQPRRIAAALQKYPITHLFVASVGLVSLFEFVERDQTDYAKERQLHIIQFGAPMPGHIRSYMEKRFHASLDDFYGMTEIGDCCTSYRAPLGYKAGSVGHPIAQEIRIHDSEVMVRGMGVFQGYENNEQVNRDSFVDGWFRTGDTGYLDEDGYLFLTGRVRELINRGGEKVSPYEVEEAILSLPYIINASVFPYPNQQGSDDVGAVVVSQDGTPVSLQEIRTALKGRIRPYKMPTLLYCVDLIPSSSANKVQRGQLYRQLNERGISPQTLRKKFNLEEGGLTPTQVTIREIWKHILEQDFVSLDDSFFDLGGDSLDAAEILAAIESSFECALPVNLFMQKSTVRELADLVEAYPKSQQFKHLVPIRNGGSKVPVFFVHAFTGEVVTYQHVSRYIEAERPVYGFNFSFEKEGWSPENSFSDIAFAYVEEMLQIYPDGPYYICGLSIGGAIAFEMASILKQRGLEGIPIMLDTYSHGEINVEQDGLTVVKGYLRSKLITLRSTRPSQLPRLVASKFVPSLQKFAADLRVKSAPKDGAQADMEINRYLSQGRPGIQKDQFLLELIYKKYQPAYYPGKVYYMQALKGKNTSPSAYWQGLCEEIVRVDKNHQHREFVEPEYAMSTAQTLNEILQEHGAS